MEDEGEEREGDDGAAEGEEGSFSSCLEGVVATVERGRPLDEGTFSGDLGRDSVGMADETNRRELSNWLIKLLMFHGSLFDRFRFLRSMSPAVAAALPFGRSVTYPVPFGPNGGGQRSVPSSRFE
jgi:hypothetical protein